MDNKEPSFVDDNDIEKKNKKVDFVKPIKNNNKKVYNVKPIKKNNSDDSLFIDDDVKPIEKNNSDDSLFIDDDVKPIEKNNSDVSLFIEEVEPIKKNKKVDVVKQIKKNNKCNKPLFIDDHSKRFIDNYSEWCDHGKWFD